MSITDHGKLNTANWIEDELEKALGAALNLQMSGPKSSNADLMQWAGGKLFELYAFVKLLKEFEVAGGYALKAKNLTKSGSYVFNGGPGRLDPSNSHIAIVKLGVEVATIWQNVEFTGIGYTPGAKEREGDYHEADVLVLNGRSPLGKKQRPNADQLLLVMECKFTAEMPKVFLRNMLGLRRVMSLLTQSKLNSPFSPVLPSLLKAVPAASRNSRSRTSHLVLAYSYELSGKQLSIDWARPAQTFGIEYWQC
jgi:hypothetical protein